MDGTTIPTVFVVDDDASVLRAVKRLLTCAGHVVETYEDPRRFLAEAPLERGGCVVLDLRMPGMNGLVVQEELSRSGHVLSVLFITGHGDIPTTVKAVKRGAVDFLPKPFEEEELLSAVARALEQNRSDRARDSERSTVLERFRKLTPREQQVAQMVARGMLSKQIAIELGTAEKTTTVHRARMMEKLGVESVPELLRLLDRIPQE